MSDDRVRTRVRSDEGWIDFQDYFVRQQCRPVVRQLAFTGAADARPQTEVMAALNGGNVRAVVICPSNPFISIEPILAVPGLRDALAKVTGTRWDVEERAGEAQPSLLEQEQAAAEADKRIILESPLVKAAFAAFPEAELLDSDENDMKWSKSA